MPNDPGSRGQEHEQRRGLTDVRDPTLTPTLLPMGEGLKATTVRDPTLNPNPSGQGLESELEARAQQASFLQ